GGELARDRLRWVAAIDKDGGARHRHRVALDRGIHVLTAALIVFGKKMKRVAGESALKLVAGKFPRKLGALLLKLHRQEQVGAVEIGADNPSSGERVGLLPKQKRGNEKQQR